MNLSNEAGCPKCLYLLRGANYKILSNRPGHDSIPLTLDPKCELVQCMLLNPEDSDTPEDDERINGYNLGDILGIPRLYLSNFIYNVTFGEAREMCEKYFPGSIGQLYYSSIHPYRYQDQVYPDLQQLRHAADVWSSTNPLPLTLLSAVQSDSSLIVHLRTGDRGQASQAFLHDISSLIRILDVKKVYVLLGVHKSWSMLARKEKISIQEARKTIFNFTTSSMISFLDLAGEVEAHFVMASADTHLCMAKEAANLLLHRGGYSCLASLLATGRVFITREFEYAINDGEWFNIMRERVQPTYFISGSRMGQLRR